MPDIKSPDIDFTVNTPANRLNMTTSEPWSVIHVMAPLAEVPSPGFFITPVLGSSGGGGGGPVTYSTPITG